MDNQPAVQTAVPTQPILPPSLPPKRNYFPFIIGGLLLLGIAGTSGLFLGKTLYSLKESGEQQEISPPTAIPTAIPTITSLLTATISAIPTSDLTANWETFTNTTYNYSFKYPSNWKYIEDSNRIIFNDSDQIDGSHYKLILSHDTKNFETLKNTLLNSEKEKVTLFQLDGKESIKRKIEALVLPTDYIFHGELPDPKAYLWKETAYEVIVSLSLNTLRIYCLLDVKNIVDQILSTFKFLDENQPPFGDAANKEECLTKGGIWQKWGMLGKEYCQIPAKDAGKSCTDGSQCSLGRCILISGKLPGECQQFKNIFGCFSFVENGQTSETLCVD